MKREFDIGSILTAFSYKGLPYPGGFIPAKPGKLSGGDYQYDGDPASEKMTSNLGAKLRKKDAKGRMYFLPVVLEHKGTKYEMPNASIGFQGKKRIVETPMVGRKGTVKELVSIDDYEITIAGVCLDQDFPEDALQELAGLYEVNESVTLKCALTDIFLSEDDKVVLRSIDIPAEKGTDVAQRFTIKLVTDKSFELIVD